MWERLAEEDAEQTFAPRTSPPVTDVLIQTVSEPWDPERSPVVNLYEFEWG
jgi:hypothetical protein